MNPKILILAVAALLLGCVAWSLLQQDPVAPAPVVDADRDASSANAEGVVGGGAQPSRRGDATPVDAAASHHREVVVVHEPLLPLPDDVEWTEVRVVDAVTDAPVAGAEVRWFDGAVMTAIGEQKLTDLSDPSIWNDPELLAERFGWLTTSDERGVARVHRRSGTQVVAREGGRYGHANLGEELVPPAGGFRIALESDSGFDVQVLDSLGEPAVGVPISIGVYGADGTFLRPHRWGAIATTHAPAGVARIAHTQALPALEDDGQPQHYRVSASVPGYIDPGVAFDPAAPPDAVLVLRLPATGRIKARASLGGRAVPFDNCSLDFYGEDAGRRYMFGGGLNRRPDDDGWARFLHVPVGKTFQVGVFCNGNWLGEEVVGPTTAGAEVEVTLSPKAAAAILTGRLVGDDLQPRASQAFELEIGGDVRHFSRYQTDAQGRFLALIGEQGEKNRAETIQFRLVEEGQPVMVATAAARDLRAGVEDLGDLVLRPDALVVAGRCEVDGAPAKLQAIVEYEEVRHDGVTTWRQHRDLVVSANDDGSFEVRGKVSADNLRLHVFDSDCLPLDPLPFRVGQRDLRVALRRGARLSVTMLTPDAGWVTVEARLARADAAAPASEGERDGRKAGVQRRDDGRQQADWRGLEPGTYALTIGLSGFPDPVHVVPDVVVPLPEGGDARLVDIDLRGALRTQVVRLFEADWRPIEHVDGGVFPLGQPETGALQGQPCWGKESKVLVPANDPRVMVAASGYRPQEVVCTGEPLDVRLDRWPSATIAVTFDGALPEGVGMRVRLVVPATDNRRWSAQWRSGRVSELLGPPSDFVEVVDGRARVAVGDEPRLLQLQVYRGNQSVFVQIPKHTISLRDPTFTLAIDDEALQRVIGGLK